MAMADAAGLPSITFIAHDVGLTGGMERALYEVVERLAKETDVAVISATLDKSLHDQVRWTQIRVPTRPFLAKYLSFAARAALSARTHRDRIVISNGALVPTAVDLAWVHFSHLAFAAELDSDGSKRSWRPADLYQRSVRWVSRSFERWSYHPRRIRTLIAVSNEAASDLRQLHAPLLVHVVPNGVDLDEFRPDPAARETIRHELGLADSDQLVLFVGGDWERKGLPQAVQAVGLLAQEFPSLHLAVAGSGDNDWLRSHASALSIGDRVHPLGFRSDVAALMNGADCLVSASIYETFNLAVYEAAAVGLPVCATPVAGVRSLIIDNQTGVVIEPTAASIADGLRRLLGDPDLASALATAAASAVAGYTWDNSTDTFRSIIIDAARNPGQ